MASLKTEETLKKLVCQDCDYTLSVPFHCGEQMIVENDKLVCWKGEHAPCCKNSSIMDIPTHHDKMMLIQG